jgi:3-hydroxy-3-methylglutaryl CoA synthase
MQGIVGYGVYLPYFRLARGAITAALGAGGGRGTRTVASFDENTTSMGVEAARTALRASPGVRPAALVFATADPAYLDKTNATAIHSAVGLDDAAGAYDTTGSVRSGVGALRLALAGAPITLVVASDLRTGLPGGGDEADGGDGAAALLVGESDAVIATPLAFTSATAEFLERWRLPGQSSSQQWEERFGEQAYVPLAQAAVDDALKQAGVTAGDLDHVIVTGLHRRAARRAAAAIGAPSEAFAPDLTTAIGNTGTAHLAVALADVLDRAQPGQIILALSLADGADAVVLRTTEAIASYTPAATVADLIASGNDSLTYPKFLTWRGMLTREPPRRPEPERYAAPAAFRREGWKFGFIGTRCEECGTRHLPPQRVCVKCGAVDHMVSESLADVPGTIATYTVDRLAFSLNPPVVVGVIDFDGGGRYQCELTDVDPSAVQIGDRVEMTFRRIFTAAGVHNYFWKARPIRRPGAQEG